MLYLTKRPLPKYKLASGSDVTELAAQRVGLTTPIQALARAGSRVSTRRVSATTRPSVRAHPRHRRVASQVEESDRYGPLRVLGHPLRAHPAQRSTAVWKSNSGATRHRRDVRSRDGCDLRHRRVTVVRLDG